MKGTFQGLECCMVCLESHQFPVFVKAWGQSRCNLGCGMSPNWIRVLAAFSCTLLDSFTFLACGVDGDEATSCDPVCCDKVTSFVMRPLYEPPTHRTGGLRPCNPWTRSRAKRTWCEMPSEGEGFGDFLWQLFVIFVLRDEPSVPKITNARVCIHWGTNCNNQDHMGMTSIGLALAQLGKFCTCV